MSQTQDPPTPPRLVAETALERGEIDELVFTQEEWEQFDQHFKRRLAGAANTDEISGKSTELEIRTYYCRQRALTEYGNE